MKQFSVLTLLLFSISYCQAQTRAVTSNGDEVILYDNGTWKYVNDSAAKSTTHIDTSTVRFSKGSTASFLIKSNKVGYGVYIDPKKWAFEKKDGGQAAEYQFTAKSKDAYGMLISEKLEMPLETLKFAALHNAKEAAPDIKVEKEEYRYVNKQLVFFMQMSGTVQGMKITYLGYYFSSDKGTAQLLTYTPTNLLEEYRKDLEALLNGFTVL